MWVVLTLSMTCKNSSDRPEWRRCGDSIGSTLLLRLGPARSHRWSNRGWSSDSFRPTEPSTQDWPEETTDSSSWLLTPLRFCRPSFFLRQIKFFVSFEVITMSDDCLKMFRRLCQWPPSLVWVVIEIVAVVVSGCCCCCGCCCGSCWRSLRLQARRMQEAVSSPWIVKWKFIF